MTNLTTHFRSKSEKHHQLKDSLTVMFADTRRGMNAETKEAFSRVKERAQGDARVAAYVAKIELSIGQHLHHAPKQAPTM